MVTHICHLSHENSTMIKITLCCPENKKKRLKKLFNRSKMLKNYLVQKSIFHASGNISFFSNGLQRTPNLKNVLRKDPCSRFSDLTENVFCLNLQCSF